MTMWKRLWWCVAAITVLGCSSSDQTNSSWRFEDSIDEPQQQPPPIVDVEPSCPSVEVDPVAFLDWDNAFDAYAPSALPSQGMLLISQSFGAANGSSDAEIFQGFDSETQIQLTDNQVDDSLVAAYKGSVLLARSTDQRQRSRSNVVWRRGAQEQILGTTELYALVDTQGYYLSRELQIVTEDHALWWRSEEQRRSQFILTLSASDGSARQLFVQDFLSPIALNERAAVWIESYDARDPNLSVLKMVDIRVPGAEAVDVVRAEAGTLSSIVLSDNVLWWLQDGTLWRRDLEEAEASAIDLEGSCQIARAAQGSLLVACLSEDFTESRLSVADAGGLRELSLFDGTIHGIRADGPFYVAVTGSADQAPNEQGIIHVGSIEGEVAPQVVDTMGLGCPFCGAIWAPAYVAIDEGLLVWNYASNGEPESRGQIGFTQLRCGR